MLKIKHIAALAVIAATLLAGCKGGSGKKQAGNPAGNRFPMPEVPAMVSDQQQALEYIAAHFWDKFLTEDRPGVQDTSLVRGFTLEAFTEYFCQYAMYLRALPPEKGLNDTRTFLDKVEKMQLENPEGTLWKNITNVYSKVLQDPNSPYRNEEYCIPLIEKRATSPLATEEEKARAAHDLPRFCLNRLGEKAADFAFTLRNGRVMNLYDIESEYTMIFFSNPGCNNCREVMEMLQGFPGIDRLIADKRLAVANVYPDEDLGEWIKYAPIYPTNWYNGYDHLLAVNRTPLYSIRAIPSIYMLDSDKRVLMKDAPSDMLMEFMKAVFGTTN